jgi:hypothetical protein
MCKSLLLCSPTKVHQPCNHLLQHANIIGDAVCTTAIACEVSPLLVAWIGVLNAAASCTHENAPAMQSPLAERQLDWGRHLLRERRMLGKNKMDPNYSHVWGLII